MKVQYTACDRCSEAISTGYVGSGELRRLTESGHKEEPVLPAGEYCTACFVGACMVGKLGLEETGKYGVKEESKPPRVKPLL